MKKPWKHSGFISTRHTEKVKHVLRYMKSPSEMLISISLLL